MKKDGALKKFWDALLGNHKTGSTRGLFEAFYQSEAAIYNFDQFVKNGQLFKKELDELEVLYSRLAVTPLGTPEYLKIEQRIQKLRDIICK